MLEISNIFTKIFNLGIDQDWENEQKRLYRKLNFFNFYTILFALSSFIFIYIFKIPAYVKLLPFLISSLYFISLIFTKNRNIHIARCISIYTFELYLLILSFFVVQKTDLQLLTYYSPIFYHFLLFPVVAFLFEISALKHFVLAILFVGIIQLKGAIESYIDIPVFEKNNLDVLHATVLLYAVLLTTIFTYIIRKENKTEKILNDVKTKELEELNNTKNILFSIISHDLRSPLCSIINIAELFDKLLQDDDRLGKLANRLHKVAKNQLELTESLLDWSKLQQNRISYTPISCNIHTLIEEILSTHSEVAKQKEIQIENKVLKDTLIKADIVLTKNILRNLLTNAIKFSYKGGTIIIDSEYNENKEFVIKIIDNGIGIPPDLLDKLFIINDSNVSRAGTNFEQGTGFGLILSKEFAELQGGNISIESVEEKGTIVKVSFPDYKSDLTAATIPSES